jgi:hypothetical protein
MDNVSQGSASPASGRGHPEYPLHRVVAAIDRSDIDAVVDALTDAGFARDGIEVVTADDVPDFDELVGGSGVRGFLRRLNLSIGDDLDDIEHARDELEYGHALVLVPVRDDAERDRAHAILHEHGGHSMRYFGRWTIATLEGDAH